MIQATCSPGQFPTFLASKLRTTRLRTPPAGFGLLRIQPRLTITMRATSALSERCSNRTLRRTSEFGCAQMAKSNNGAPGIDGVAFEAIEESGVEGFLKQIQDELDQNT